MLLPALPECGNDQVRNRRVTRSSLAPPRVDQPVGPNTRAVSHACAAGSRPPGRFSAIVPDL